MLTDILIIGAAGLVLTSGAFTQSSAESAEDAARLIAEISAELTEESRLSLARVDDLEDRLATGFDNLAAIAEEMDVQWGASIGVDLKGASLAPGVTLDPDSLDDDDRMPRPDDRCEVYERVPAGEGSSIVAQWRRCSEFESIETRTNFIDFAELLYGQDGNWRRVMVAIVVSSPDEEYLQRSTETARDMIDATLASIVAETLDSTD